MHNSFYWKQTLIIGVFAFKSADGTCKGLMDVDLNTSNAQIVTPISLQIGSTLNVNSSGTKVGSFLTTAQSMYIGTGVLMTTSNDLMGAYFTKNYTDPTGSGIVAGKYYLYSSIYVFSSIFQGLTSHDLLNANLITASTTPTSLLYFSAAGCSGDLLVVGSQTDFIKGTVFISPTGCTGAYPHSCSTYTPKKINTTGSYQENFSYLSYIYTDGMNPSNNTIYCLDNSGTVSGLVVQSANITNLDANDPPAVINGLTVNK